MPDLLTVVTSLTESAVALEQITPQFARLSDLSLLAQQARLAEARRRLDAAVAVSSAEIARRSHRDLGSDGLAQRLGARTPERLVEQVSGVSKREASTLVRVGGMLQPTPTSDPPKPWLAAIARAVQHGLLSIEAADVLRASIGEPSESVTPEALTAAVEKVLDEAATLTLDQLAARAREARDNLDAAGVADREAQRRDRRFLRLMPQWDGMVRLSGLLDPESAALVTDAFDSVTSPRRGGPRFVEKGAADRAQSILDDPRTTDQIMVDTFARPFLVALPFLGALAHPARIGRPDPNAHPDAHEERSPAPTAARGVARWSSVSRLCNGRFAPVVGRVETSRRKRRSGAQVCRDLATQDAAPVVELVETSRRETPRPAKVHPRGCNERRPRAAARSRPAERRRPQQRAAQVSTA